MAQYDPLVPTGFVDLDTDYANLQNNFQQLDDIFGIDHVKYSIITNSGFHNKVTTPDQVTAPVTVTNPVMYGLQFNTAVGLLQYSRGPNNAVPSPITNLQSSATGISLLINTTTNILDFTGIGKCICHVYAATMNGVALADAYVSFPIFWTGTTFVGTIISVGSTPVGTFTLENSVNILRIKANVALNNLFWTLRIERIQ